MFDEYNSTRYSIVVPLYNERDNIAPLHQSLTGVMKELGYGYELVFVDDGSTDGSIAVLKELAQQDAHLTVVALRKNSGKSAALCAGFDSAVGSFLITMDGDLQHPPELAARLVAIGQSRQLDLVAGTRYQDGGDAAGLAGAKPGRKLLGVGFANAARPAI